MANYYQTARQAKKDLKTVGDDNKRRRQLRQEQGLEPSGVEHPLNYLTLDGRPCKLFKNLEQHAAIERQDGLIPWNGDPDNLIDRFDARSLLDFYRDPPPNVQQRPKTPQEEKLQELLVFESYRDLVKLMARGLSEEAGLRVAHDENLEIRAQRRGTAAAAFRVQSHQQLPGDEAAVAAGAGMYSAVGFQYGGGTEEVSSSSSDDDDDDDDEATAEGAEGEAEQDRLDALAEQFGIADFSYRLHKVQQGEGDMEEAWRWKPRKRTGRKAARERARRMAGQGLAPTGRPLQKDWREAGTQPSKARRTSPELRGRSRSRSCSPNRRSTVLFPMPAIQAAKIDRKAFQREDDILDALPDSLDPALEGAQHFPAAAQLQAIIKEQQEARRRKSPSRSRSRSRGRSYRDRHRRDSRSRSRSREWRKWREEARRRSRSRSSSRSRSRDRDRDRHRSRNRSRSRSVSRGRADRSGRSSRDEHRGRTGGSGGSGSAGGGAGVSSSHKPSRPGSASAAATSGAGASNAGAAKTETPAERLKRIMAAQLNKQQSKDTVVSTNKKIQDEKEKALRMQMQRAARYGGPPGGRGRSPSPHRY